MELIVSGDFLKVEGLEDGGEKWFGQVVKIMNPTEGKPRDIRKRLAAKEFLRSNKYHCV